MAIEDLRTTWNRRARRANPLQAVMSMRWTPDQCELATRSLKSSLHDMMGNVAGKSILECGSGVGRFTRDFRNFGAKVVGVDLSEEMISRAKKSLNRRVNYINGSVDNLPVPSGCFDITFEVTVLIHIPHAMFVSALHEMRRVTKPDGLIICFDPLNNDSQPFSSTNVTTLRPMSAYVEALNLGEPLTEKVFCVDDMYTLMVWRNNPLS